MMTCGSGKVRWGTGGWRGPGAGIGRKRVVCVRMSGGGKEEEGGDSEVQRYLVEMVRLQTGKMRVSEFVEERSSYLSDIAEQAKVEGDRIAEELLKGIEEVESKVMKKVEEDAQALEEEIASARAEVEANEREFERFERDLEEARNQGLFFKSSRMRLGKGKEGDLRGRRSRRSLYGLLMFILTFVVVQETVSAGDVNLAKLLIYALVMAFLIVQLWLDKSESSAE